MTAGSPIDGQHFAGLEVRHNCGTASSSPVSGLRPTRSPHPGVEKAPKPTQLELVRGQGRANLLEHGADDPLDVAQ